MKETFRCPHGTVKILVGSGHKVYCPECKSYLISDEEIQKKEMKLNKKEQGVKKMNIYSLKLKNTLKIA